MYVEEVSQFIPLLQLSGNVFLLRSGYFAVQLEDNLDSCFVTVTKQNRNTLWLGLFTLPWQITKLGISEREHVVVKHVFKMFFLPKGRCATHKIHILSVTAGATAISRK